MNSNRPRNLGLMNLIAYFPIQALTSILHRITGIMLLVGVGILLLALNVSLESQAGFNEVATLINHPFGAFILWGVLSSVIYHFVAGIKHLLMDAGIGETKEGGKLGSIVSLLISIVLIVLAGVWLW